MKCMLREKEIYKVNQSDWKSIKRKTQHIKECAIEKKEMAWEKDKKKKEKYNNI